MRRKNAQCVKMAADARVFSGKMRIFRAFSGCFGPKIAVAQLMLIKRCMSNVTSHRVDTEQRPMSEPTKFIVRCVENRKRKTQQLLAAISHQPRIHVKLPS